MHCLTNLTKDLSGCRKEAPESVGCSVGVPGKKVEGEGGDGSLTRVSFEHSTSVQTEKNQIIIK